MGTSRSTCASTARAAGPTRARPLRSSPSGGLLGADVAFPGPARPLRRGRHRAGSPRAARRPVRGRRRDGLRGGDGQGGLQGADDGARHPAGGLRGDSRGRHGHAPAARVREARAAGLVGGHRRRPGPRPISTARSRAPFSTTHSCWWSASRTGSRWSAPCSATATRSRRSPGEIVLTDSDWYDYEAKYQPGGMELVVPARVPEAVREEVRRLAVEVFKLIDCSGMAQGRLLR